MTDIRQGSFPNPPKQYTITIPAGGTTPFYYNFDFMRVITLATADAPNLLLRFGDTGEETNIIGAGLGYELPWVIDRFSLRNIGATPITLTFIIAIGRIHDDRLTLIGGTIPTSEQAATMIDSLPDVSLPATTTTQIIAANSAAKERIITNLPTNAREIRIGDSGAGAANGIYLGIGQSIVLECSAALYAYNPHSSAQTVSVTELDN